jgi:tetratricopeptide (TPR) repeat protein
MAKQQHDMLEEFESSAERMADWVRRHMVWVGGGILLLLAVAWGLESWSGASEAAEQEAAAQLAETRAAYRVAMGGDPTSLEVPELANPEAARAIRQEYAARFRELAEANPGTVAATLAQLEALDLESPEPEVAVERLTQVLARTPRSGSLRAVVLERLGLALEAAGRFDEAAARYESAGEISAFPLRSFALADAARCRAQAGQPGRALALYDRIETEFPDVTLPEYHRALRRELQATVVESS